MSGYLTTHVLDTARGVPAAGLQIILHAIDGDNRKQLAAMTTNHDGRTDSPILPPDQFAVGKYELIFQAGDYLRQQGMVPDSGNPLFLDEVPIRFGIDDPNSHYHVPLLLSPYGYSTYRGS